MNRINRSRRLPFLFLLALPLALAAQDEFFETLPNGARPPVVSGASDEESAFPGATRQSVGPLSGRIVFTSAGHGWTWSRRGWVTQRGITHEMNEDYGNLDQMNFFTAYLLNAGATVVPFRPLGYQTNEVVLDNDSPGVRFSGKWFNSQSTVYFGDAGDVPYRFALLNHTETATATYTPKIPQTGFYPVYTWVRHGPDRTSQLYRILHTGGQTLVRVPHHMVGSGWVYLGTYHFNAGASRKNGSVVVSNLQPSPGFGAVTVADAIRFGNGMGDIVPAPGAPVSGYPREEEASRYWVLKALGHGQENIHATDSEDHQPSNVGAPPRAAREMNRETEGNLYQRIFISFHSNAGGGRGTIGLWNDPELFPGTMTPNQERLAELIGREINDIFTANAPPLEVPWFGRTRLTYARNDYAFGEINNRAIQGEFDATIIEIAFHDSKDDALLMRDPKVRDVAGRASYQSVVRYMNEFDDAPLRFLPEPPRNVRATGSREGVTVAWDAPACDGGARIEGYLVARSTDGYGFGNPVRVPASQRSLALRFSPRDEKVYFRVTAVNAGGESLPSAVVGCRPATRESARRVLVVNGFTRFDRFNNPRQTLQATNYTGLSAAGRMDRVIPRLNNAFDYVVQHGQALSANRAAFDSCQREAVGSGLIHLEHYETVIWAAGRQHTDILTESETEALSRYVNLGGNLFISGTHIAELLSSSETDSRKGLGALPDAVTGAIFDTGALGASFSPMVDSLFRRCKPGTFGEAREQSYFVGAASRFSAHGTAQAALIYSDAPGAAALQFDAPGGGKLVCLGFPFETISSARARADYLSAVLRFFDFHAPRRWIIEPEVVQAEDATRIVWRATPGRTYQVQFNAAPGGVLWQNLGKPVSPAALTAVARDSEPRPAASYRVLMLN